MRLLIPAGVVAALLTLASAPAYATTTVGKSNGELVVTAAPAHMNVINVSLVGATYFVTDSGDTVSPVPGSGCAQGGNPNTVTCPMFAVGRVAVLSDDLTDNVT